MKIEKTKSVDGRVEIKISYDLEKDSWEDLRNLKEWVQRHFWIFDDDYEPRDLPANLPEP